MGNTETSKAILIATDNDDTRSFGWHFISSTNKIGQRTPPPPIPPTRQNENANLLLQSKTQQLNTFSYYRPPLPTDPVLFLFLSLSLSFILFRWIPLNYDSLLVDVPRSSYYLSPFFVFALSFETTRKLRPSRYERMNLSENENRRKK